jgi:hypothetical protein
LKARVGINVTISSDRFGEICEHVWQNRTAVVNGRGFLSPEAALARAVYWRLCKAGVEPADRGANDNLDTFATYQLAVRCVLELSANPPFDSAPFLNGLVERYREEACS